MCSENGTQTKENSLKKDARRTFRLESTRDEIKVDTNPTYDTVEKLTTVIEAELEECVNVASTTQPKVKSINAKDDPKGKGDSKGKGKDDAKGAKGDSKGKGKKGKADPCKYFETPEGCRFGQQCKGYHRLLMFDEGKCYVCGTLGESLYVNLKDRLFGASGNWNLKKCPNQKCGLVWLDPMPLKEDIIKAYHNYPTHNEASKTSYTFLYRSYLSAKEGFWAYRYGYHKNLVSISKKLLGVLVYLHPGLKADFEAGVMFVPAEPKGRLLDVGCGSGSLLQIFANAGWQVEGVDFDPAAVKNAKGKGLQVRCGALGEQKYPDNHFDIITLSHLIEHVYDPLEQLRECHRILRPGGYLVLVTPNINSLSHRRFKEAYLHLDPPRHLHIFSPQALRLLAEKAGFQKLQLTTTIRQANNVYLSSRVIQRSGLYVFGSPRPWNLRIWSIGMQLTEWMILRLKPDVGTEITLIGYK